jgi:hypothetical protein
MCAVSFVTHGITQDYPNFPSSWPQQQLVDLSEVLKRLDAIDKALEAKNCDEPGKEEFFRKLNQRIEALERKGRKKAKR